MKSPAGFFAVIQCAVETCGAAAAMNSTMMTSLMATMTLLTRADSWTPMIKSIVIRAITTMAGALITAPVKCQACCAAS